MNKNSRVNTLIFGLISGLCAIPFIRLAGAYWEWPVVFKLFVLVNLILYTVVLCRSSATSPGDVFFPLLLVSGIALLPCISTGFFLFVMVLLSWIRSGICWKNGGARAFLGEVLTLLGTAGLVFFWWPGSPLSLPLVVWMFYLIQSLYFFIVPGGQTQSTASMDSFDQASLEVERLLGTFNTGD